MPDPHIVTFGCRLNSLESEIIRAEAAAADAGDAVVINTCAVTGEAVRQARQAIRRLRRERPESRIIVTGCAAQLEPDAFAAMAEVDRVLGNAEKLHRRHYAPAESDGAGVGGERVVVSDIMSAPEATVSPVDEFDGRSRAMVQIQQGCDHRCTFCAIPFARGPNRSVPPDRIVDQVRILVERGYPEVVLTGVDICSYGGDRAGGPTLAGLVRTLLAAVGDLRRLRLSSLDPAAIDRDLVALMSEEARLMPHAHLSLQAADDMVLKRMKRRHTRAGALTTIDALRRARPDIAFGADLIAGFPTETEAMFANTLSFISEARLTYLHVFPFSPRPDTPAARMPAVPGPVRRERAAVLRRAGAAATAAHFHGRIGDRVEVAVENERTGRCPDFAPVALDFAARPGEIIPAHIVGATPAHLIGARA
ncbi:MAG: tRNA (N(6)-L-threonylcarbamoyladenosine(37)-C(2))-methylthiotransferase MtaB [Rhodospirillales bacterium]|nr:tRNA (N(6)-L-threonylcarbamoyladenosine(37)-C(2))-methylthiotransferase MtaB [Rhodospirillales bacterium]